MEDTASDLINAGKDLIRKPVNAVAKVGETLHNLVSPPKPASGTPIHWDTPAEKRAQEAATIESHKAARQAKTAKEYKGIAGH
jgi:hypothetical protein